MTEPHIFTSIDPMRQRIAQWRQAGQRIAFVPTMGALHEGHISLTQNAKAQADRVIVSIFVNPTQFAPNEDFASYPRTFEADVARLAAAGVDGVYYPTTDIIYPPGFVTTISLAGPATAGLEDIIRPTHFQGVATVVAKLLIQVGPDIAIFGEKDFQQLAVLRRLALDLDLPVTIIGAPIVRETDGLAMSSRNAYLKPDERAVAPTLYRALQAARQRLRAKDEIQTVLTEASATITASGFVLDYLELRDAGTLGAPHDHGRRLLVAARIGKTRLIDNVAVDE